MQLQERVRPLDNKKQSFVSRFNKEEIRRMIFNQQPNEILAYNHPYADYVSAPIRVCAENNNGNQHYRQSHNLLQFNYCQIQQDLHGNGTGSEYSDYDDSIYYEMNDGKQYYQRSYDRLHQYGDYLMAYQYLYDNDYNDDYAYESDNENHELFGYHPYQYDNDLEAHQYLHDNDYNGDYAYESENKNMQHYYEPFGYHPHHYNNDLVTYQYLNDNEHFYWSQIQEYLHNNGTFSSNTYYNDDIFYESDNENYYYEAFNSHQYNNHTVTPYGGFYFQEEEEEEQQRQQQQQQQQPFGNIPTQKTAETVSYIDDQQINNDPTAPPLYGYIQGTQEYFILNPTYIENAGNNYNSFYQNNQQNNSSQYLLQNSYNQYSAVNATAFVYRTYSSPNYSL